ncbi:MAG: L-lactate permease [Cyanobacteriota bacterium]|nr:L-lactate permease [Cyanobacteriota bacterium]
MNEIRAIIGITPVILSISIILFLKRNTVTGALGGIFLGLSVIAITNWFTLNYSQLLTAIFTSAILTISAALVIVPGLYLNAILEGQGKIKKLSDTIKLFQLDNTHKALLLLIAFLPAIESLTGFGVSLFLSIPLFFSLFPDYKAYRLSIIGMNIMPWGTLALATIVGASLSQEPVNQLSATTALTSLFVFPTFGLIGAYIIDGIEGIKRNLILVLTMGLFLSIMLYVFSWLGLTELAGVLSGLTVGLTALIILNQHQNKSKKSNHKQIELSQLLRLLAPYLILLLLILASRGIQPVSEFLSAIAILQTSRIKFVVFTSPGIFVGIVAAIWYFLEKVKISHLTILDKSQKTCLSLFMFAFMAQLMQESGMLSAFSLFISSISQGKAVYMFVTPALGMLSGNITGSNVGGNALMMTLQHSLGASIDNGLLFAAVQNSAAGYAVFTSSAIVVLTMTIAKNFERNHIVSEHQLVSFGLKSAFFVYLALILGFWTTNLVIR